MLVIRNTREFRIESPSIVTIGTFDGVHLGHQKILDRLAEIKARTGLLTVVLTFEPHPRKVLFPEQKDLKLITLIEEKLDLLRASSVDVTVVYPFDLEFAHSSSAFYVEQILVKQLQVKYLVIGHDHRFGHNRSGDYTTLLACSKQFGFQLEEIPAQDIDSIAISSSKIRKAIEEGKPELAQAYSGHMYFINALVIKGKQLGRQLGYPTANLLLNDAEKILPAKGIYLVGVEFEGKHHFGMMNVGTNPTTDTGNDIKLEVHIFDFNSDIYNKHLTIRFIKHLRDEKKFPDLESLKAQLRKDEEDCMNLISAVK
ncbi:MAG TPA: bifunctional riboflavin kinase/FAD synthetase [Bacteroidia bacterium]|nr:bifunctional riboflavin kinase/FAD synthetase [Bacteroidia bacterium]